MAGREWGELMAAQSDTRLHEVVAATWPAAETAEAGGFLLRRGAGGGNRTSAASPLGADWDIAAAEAAMRAWGQRPLFRIRPEDGALDAALAARGYAILDPTRLLAAPVAALAAGLAPAAADPRVIPCEAPLAIMAALWDAGGIGAARRAVMARVAGPRVWLLGRDGERAAGCGFAGVHAGVVMLHALEVAAAFRGRGLGEALSRGAAAWGQAQGAATLALAVTEANAAAQALYGRLGMAEAGRYHYRRAPEQEG